MVAPKVRAPDDSETVYGNEDDSDTVIPEDLDGELDNDTSLAAAESEE